MRWLRHSDDLGYLLLLFILALLMMLPYLLQPEAVMWPRSGLGSDVTYRWTSVHFARQSLQDTGSMPLWQSGAMGGLPLIGNPGLRVYYPPQLLFTLLPIPITTGFAILNMLHLWLAGAGGYGLARFTLRTSRPAAFVAGLALLFAPLLSSNITGDLSYAQGLCLSPLVFLCIQLTLDRRSWRWATAAGFGLALLYIANIQIIVYVVWFAGVYWLYSGVWSYRQRGNQAGIAPWLRDWLWQGVLLALILLLCMGFAAFQMLPFISFLPDQIRQRMTLADNNFLALPLPLLINILAPTAFKFPEWELYVGLLPLALLPLAWRHTNRRGVLFWTGVLVFCLLFALGTATPVFTLMVQFVPGFGLLRVAPRIWMIAATATALLTGLAVDALLDHERLDRRWWRWLLLAAGVLMIGTVTIRFLARRPNEPDWLLGFSACAGLALGLFAIWRRPHLSATGFAALMALAVGIDLLPQDFTFHTPTPFMEIFSPPEIMQSLPAGERYRVYGTRRDIPEHIAERYGIELADGLNSFQFAPYSRFMRLASGCDLAGIAAAVPACASDEIDPLAYLTATPNPALLGLLNVRYIIAGFELPPQPELSQTAAAQGLRLYENAAVLPRAFVVGRVTVLENEDAVWDALPDLNPRETVLIDQGQAGDFPAPQHDFFAPAAITRYTADEIHIHATMPEDGMLVIGEPWVTGWTAQVNGVTQPVLRVDGALRGLYLPAGEHDAVLVFRPPAFTIGLAVTFLTLLVSGVALLLGSRRRTQCP